MKKILLISVLCLAIIACGKKEEAQQEATQATKLHKGKVLKYLILLLKLKI